MWNIHITDTPAVALGTLRSSRFCYNRFANARWCQQKGDLFLRISFDSGRVSFASLIRFQFRQGRSDCVSPFQAADKWSMRFNFMTIEQQQREMRLIRLPCAVLCRAVNETNVTAHGREVFHFHSARLRWTNTCYTRSLFLSIDFSPLFAGTVIEWIFYFSLAPLNYKFAWWNWKFAYRFYAPHTPTAVDRNKNSTTVEKERQI